MNTIIIIFLILSILLVIFTLQNSFEITINVFFWKIHDAPLVLVLLSCILLGYIIAAIYFCPKLWKLKKSYKQLLSNKQKFIDEEEIEDKHQSKQNPEGIDLDTIADID